MLVNQANVRLKIKNEIGNGSYGKVYKAQWNGQLVAVKILHKRFFELDQEDHAHGHVDKFHNECKILQELNHKNVVRLKEFLISHLSPPMLITELLEHDLVKYIGELHPDKIPFPETVSIALDVAEGLVYLHQRNPPIVHRDLASRNVLLTKEKQAKIADLGLAKCFSTEQRMLSSPNCGTPAYAAPETISTNPRNVVYGVKIDIFSFGVVLMEVINSSRPKMEPDWPFESDGRRIPEKLRRRNDISKMGEHKLSGLVLRCIEDDSDERPDAAEIVGCLQIEQSKIQEKNEIARRSTPRQPPKLKIIALGNSGTGKTSVIKRFVHGQKYKAEFENYTVGQEIYARNIALRDKEYCLHITDTAGQEKFHSIPPNFLRGANGVLLVFELTERASFVEGIPRMLKLVDNNKADNTSIILVGNKVDEKDHQVSSAEAEEYARALGVQYIETSAKTGHNIETVFEMIATEIHVTLDLSDIDTYVPSAGEYRIRLGVHAPPRRNICARMRDWMCS